MLKKKPKLSFDFKVLMCFFFVIVIFLFCFSVYIFNIQKKQGQAIMENYNRNIIMSVEESFSVINESAGNQIMRTLSLPAATRLIYRSNDDQNQHVLDINSLTHEFKTIPYFDSALTYNNMTKVFEFYGCSREESSDIIDNITYNGKVYYPYTPYVTMIKGNTRSYPVFTYYGFDFLSGETMNGAIAVNISLDWMKKAISSLGLEGMNIILCDHDGRIAYNYNDMEKYDSVVDEDYKSKILANVNKTGFTTNINGEKCYVTVSNLLSNYLLICEQPYDAIYSVYMNQIWVNLVILVIIILIIGILAAKMLASYISAPINKMSRYIGYTSRNKVNDDIFKDIYSILESSVYNNFQLSEMKKTIDDYKEQNNLIMLMSDNRNKLPEDDYNALERYFGDEKLVGVELLFEHSVDASRVREICRLFLEDYIEYKFAVVEYNDFILVLKGQDRSLDSIRILLESLKNRLETEYDQRVSVFISSDYAFSDIVGLYNEIQFIRRYELIYSRGCMLDKKTIDENCVDCEYTYPKKEENSILKAIINKNSEEAELLFGDFLSKIMGMNVDDFRASILRLALNIQVMFEMESKITPECYDAIVELVKQIPKLQTMNDICTNFAALVDKCCNITETEESAKYSHTVQQIIDYIEENFANASLNLEMIADALKLSANYSGKQFKAETGVALNKYLTEYRLKKSLYYLNETDENINSIIEKVGFANESNFYRQFKKYYGITPREYKKIL